MNATPLLRLVATCLAATRRLRPLARAGLIAGGLALAAPGCIVQPRSDDVLSNPSADADGDGWSADEDCDDGDPNAHPGSNLPECDGTDYDCDGEVLGCDDSCEDPYSACNLMPDEDGDGWDGWEDCDDTDPTIHPGADIEECDAVDRNCDGELTCNDANVDDWEQWDDCDSPDVWCNAAPDAPADEDGDGYDEWVDCDDSDPAVHPNALEPACSDVDYDCDGTFVACDPIPDSDGDGFDADVDCDDGDAAVHPGAVEPPCGDRDYDCDGILTCEPPPDDCEGSEDCDLDGDGWQAWEDCDDHDPAVNPGVDGVEECGSDHDLNCDGVLPGCDWVEDEDGDGSPAGQDCDDANASAFPGAPEPECSAADLNCDGVLAVCAGEP